MSDKPYGGAKMLAGPGDFATGRGPNLEGSLQAPGVQPGFVAAYGGNALPTRGWRFCPVAIVASPDAAPPANSNPHSRRG